MNGVIVVDLRGGGLVYGKALSASFAKHHPHKTHMNLAALLFAIYNYAASVTTDAAAAGLRQYETHIERLVFEVAPTKQWLVVVFAATRGLPEDQLWRMTNRLAQGLDSFDAPATESRVSQSKRLHGILCQILYESILCMAKALVANVNALQVVVYCTPPKSFHDDVRAPELSASATIPSHSSTRHFTIASVSSRWRRRWHALWRTNSSRHHQVQPQLGMPPSGSAVEALVDYTRTNERRVLVSCPTVDGEHATAPDEWTTSTVEAVLASSTRIDGSRIHKAARSATTKMSWLVLEWDRLHVLVLQSGEPTMPHCCASPEAPTNPWPPNVESRLQTLLAVADNTWGLMPPPPPHHNG
ncbi:hypothetical protein H310_05266 [Aphanomyces invadans]|uniref:Uncharacterized protein n=1 Tax=Aphanomyces invadans TaxID=157072 RepID=A0A024U919_9STRA|nr:hypothetical protein H310_05266 [Aphanomyces invadans]ETW02774.1 hypothetical protein H310_05266 [Aphanomyces invadans]|eukprot:XP_008868158.1 hypothetical protein H310_05266 [Aphanomyces invadans]